MTFVFPFIAGRKVDQDTDENEIYASITEHMRSPDVNELAQTVFGRDLNDTEIATPERETRLYVRKAFENVSALGENETGFCLTAQGVPGSGKSTGLWRYIQKTMPEMAKQSVMYAYDRNGVLEQSTLWQQGKKHIEDQKNTYSNPFEYQRAKLALRDLLRYATAVGYDIVKNKTLAARYNAINDTTVSSPHAVAAMRQYSASNFVNHGLSFHAPLGASLKRCFGRDYGIGMKEEVLGKRGSVMKNYSAFVDTIVKDKGRQIQSYTPDVNGEFTTAIAFTLSDGVIAEKNPKVINEMIRGLKVDLSAFDLLVSDYAILRNQLNKEYDDLESGTEVYIEKLSSIRDTQIGNSPAPTPSGA
ncbi:MAG: hypothetical protein KTR28_09460 [Micavibrio sp.]|nr:hypothetical protein [Micavibrio sp.]